MLTEPMPADAVEAARKRLAVAAEDLDANRIAALVRDLAAEAGVAPVWERVRRPLLGGPRGHSATEIAVEHALSEGVRIGLDGYRRDRGRPLPPDGVLLAGAEQEAHCLGLHALAAALREQGRGCLLLGPALPWAALAAAVVRVRPHSPGLVADPAHRPRVPPGPLRARLSPGTPLRRGARLDRAVPAAVGTPHHLRRRRRRLRGGSP
ncbi:hypothetical protein M2302_001466 [Micromonospora sp. A200]|uniref:hypothetical protein n=1 Tax=Micromonospora sp. A200 TaxID=2940568 RepID=UPI0024736084|nr:hypothetical protein [Micromonospora sp. A200]MDH6461296.1 hypothetical protein [Micromonospora sp. A200]